MEKFKGEAKHGLLKRNLKIVKIDSDSNCNCCPPALQRIYFKSRRKFRKPRPGWAHREDFLKFSDNKKDLKKFRYHYKKVFNKVKKQVNLAD